MIVSFSLQSFEFKELVDFFLIHRKPVCFVYDYSGKFTVIHKHIFPKHVFQNKENAAEYSMH